MLGCFVREEREDMRMFKTDLEIAQECVMEGIDTIAEKVGLSSEDLEH